MEKVLFPKNGNDMQISKNGSQYFISKNAPIRQKTYTLLNKSRNQQRVHKSIGMIGSYNQGAIFRDILFSFYNNRTVKQKQWSSDDFFQKSVNHKNLALFRGIEFNKFFVI